MGIRRLALTGRRKSLRDAHPRVSDRCLGGEARTGRRLHTQEAINYLLPDRGGHMITRSRGARTVWRDRLEIGLGRGWLVTHLCELSGYAIHLPAQCATAKALEDLRILIVKLQHRTPS